MSIATQETYLSQRYKQCDQAPPCPSTWDFYGDPTTPLTFPTLCYAHRSSEQWIQDTEEFIRRYIRITPWLRRCGSVDPLSVFPASGQTVKREVKAVEKNRAQFGGQIYMVPHQQPGYEEALDAFDSIRDLIDRKDAQYLCGIVAIMFAIESSGTNSRGLNHIPHLTAFRERARYIHPTILSFDGTPKTIIPEQVLPNTIYRERLMRDGCSFDFKGITDPNEIIRIYNSLGQNMRLLLAVLHDEPCYASNGYTHWYTLLKVISRGVNGFDNIEQLPHLLATKGLNELAHATIDPVGSLEDQYAVLAGELGPLGISETPFCVVPLHNLLQSTTAVIGHVPRPTDRRAGRVLRTTQVGGMAFRENICVVSVP